MVTTFTHSPKWEICFREIKGTYLRRVLKPTTVCIDVFLVDNGNFKNVLSFEEWPMVYIGDAIKDVNGDKLNDVLLTGMAHRGVVPVMRMMFMYIIKLPAVSVVS
jgi:hypothetical protein